MPIGTWLRYLLGDRHAILQIAADPRAIWLGALFVLSAGFARGYDGEDLLHEPWHLLLPFAASLGTSFVLFCVTWAPVRLKEAAPPLPVAYRAFLGLFWLTAPLAWFYAVPYERFLSPLDATRANLWTLGLVAVWRVFLVVRVVTVLMGYRAWQAVSLVMLVADAEAFLALHFLPRPIIPFMSGMRVTDSEYLVARVGDGLQTVTFLSLPLWIAGAVAVTCVSKPHWQAPRPAEPVASRGLTILAIASVMVWLLILPFTQPEQILRRRVEQALREGRIADALAEMSAHERSDFPPHWDPTPPATGKQMFPELPGGIWSEMEKAPLAPWVTDFFREKRAARQHR